MPNLKNKCEICGVKFLPDFRVVKQFGGVRTCGNQKCKNKLLSNIKLERNEKLKKANEQRKIDLAKYYS